MQRFANNWNLKLMSLVLAVALWSHVRGEVNPWETASFRVPLLYEVPSQMVLLNRESIPQEVVVRVRAPRSSLRELKGFTPPNPLVPNEEPSVITGGEITATLDFSAVRLGKQDAPVKATAKDPDMEIIGVKPVDVALVIDQAAQKRISLRPQLITARGYEITNVSVRESTAIVFGPSNVLEGVAGVQARIRSGALSLNASKTIDVPLVAIDSDGEALENVRIEPRQITATAMLRQKIVTQSLRVTAKVPSAPVGFKIADISVEPRRIAVRGPLLALSEAPVLSVNLSAAPEEIARGTVQKRVRVAAPNGTKIVGPDVVTVKVLWRRPANSAVVPQGTPTPPAIRPIPAPGSQTSDAAPQTSSARTPAPVLRDDETAPRDAASTRNNERGEVILPPPAAP